MNINLTNSIMTSVPIICLFILSISASYAQSNQDASIAQPGDPARWYQEDMTPHGYFLTLKKEAMNVYQDSSKKCMSEEKSNRKQCMIEAKNTFKQDMDAAKEKSGSY
ncbi:hypothetical protein [Solimicrobium silvestre]|uniref:Uncharacterized protein n=1 Tax=Solimicrobium silvestre TaxID=2099400 RepID=A0A2S9GUT2_9BURK|nr:hypothetical protein [Solimicrobium silvestre]PRC91458.1 hypothetical protein S2091_3873 [Solimicrobium silvestre]